MLIVLTRRAASIAAACLLACLPLAARGDDWEAYQHDVQHTGFSSSNLIPTSLSLSWRAPQGFTEPIIVGNSVLAVENQNVANTPAVVDSFNITNGTVNWSTNANFSGASHIAYGGGLIAVGTITNANSIETGHLNVLNATTGASLYSMIVPQGSGSFLTIAADTTTALPVAYIDDGRGQITAVRLGQNSGTTLWTASHLLSAKRPPSIAGDLLLTASADHYYAINRTTGAVTPIYEGPFSGGVGSNIVVDTNREQFYILNGYGSGSTPVNTISAYGYTGGTITQLWQRSGAGIDQGTPAIDASGNIYSADQNTLIELNPTNGQIIRSISGSFVFSNAPIVTPNYIWEFGPRASPTNVYAYNAGDLSLAAAIQVDQFPTSLYSTAAIDDRHLIEDFGGGSSSPGFEVFTGVPEPSSTCALVLTAVTVLRRPRRRE